MAPRFEVALTSKNMADLLPAFLKKIHKSQGLRPDLILAAWPKVVGERLSSMTKAVSFEEGVLKIKVQSSSLLSLLKQHEEERLLKELRSAFPSVLIRTIRFYMG